MPKTFMRSFMAVLVAHCRRWVDVTLDLGGEDLTFLYGLPDDAFPLLERFILSDSCGAFSDRLSQALSAAPRLHTVSLDHSIIDMWALQWSNLTSLSLATADTKPHKYPAQLSMVYLYNALQRCTRLRSLSLTFPPEFQYEDNTNIIHPDGIMDVRMVSLESLTLSMDPDLVGTLADNLRAPNLKELSLYTHGLDWGDDSIGDWEAFLEFVDEFSDSLERATFHGPKLTITQWDDLLSALTIISELTVVETKSCINGPSILRCLTIKDSARCVHLRSLNLQQSPLLDPQKSESSKASRTYFEYLPIMAMVQSRSRYGHPGAFTGVAIDPLESLTLLDTDLARMKEKTPTQYAWLQRLIAQGLRVDTVRDALQDTGGSELRAYSS